MLHGAIEMSLVRSFHCETVRKRSQAVAVLPTERRDGGSPGGGKGGRVKRKQQSDVKSRKLAHVCGVLGRVNDKPTKPKFTTPGHINIPPNHLLPLSLFVCLLSFCPRSGAGRRTAGIPGSPMTTYQRVPSVVMMAGCSDNR